MKKEICNRAFWGFCLGVTINFFVLTVVSFFVSEEGAFTAVMPQLRALFSTELAAVAVQTFLCGVICVVFAEAGILFFSERWNFPQKCLLHFAVTAPFYLPFLWLCYFAQAEWWKFLLIPANVIATYLITWIVNYSLLRADVKRINRRLDELRKNIQ